MIFSNKYGNISPGMKVRFNVENPNQYVGENHGILEWNGSEFVIRTIHGIMTINKGYDAYFNTVQQIK